jgi:peroxin-5
VNLATSIAEQTKQPESEVLNKPHFDSDELARTAGMLIENLKHETNPKFQKSQFMELMKQLRDGEVVVKGDQMVENDTRMRNSEQINIIDPVISTGKGKGRADSYPNHVDSPMFRVRHEHILPLPQQLTEQKEGEQEDLNDAYFRQENVDYSKYWQGLNGLLAPSALTTNAQEKEWDSLQDDWDRFEATSTGIKKLNSYQFQHNNPYLLGDSSRTRHHALHYGLSPVLEVRPYLFHLLQDLTSLIMR